MFFFLLFARIFLLGKKWKKISSLPGVEPGIFCSVGRRVIHCATSPMVQRGRTKILLFDYFVSHMDLKC